MYPTGEKGGEVVAVFLGSVLIGDTVDIHSPPSSERSVGSRSPTITFCRERRSGKRPNSRWLFGVVVDGLLYS